MSSQSPQITVLMPVHNECPRYLKRAAQSVLTQTHKDFEFLIIDDGSTRKDTQKTLKNLTLKDSRIHLIKNKQNLGLARSLNRGLKLAQGQFIARLDADDLAAKNRLATQLQFMQKNPDCALCGSWANLINEQGQKIGQKKFYSDYLSIKKNILKFNFFTHSTWFFRKMIIQKFSGYSMQAPLNEDYDLLLKIIPRYRVENLPRFLGSYRINQQSLTAKQHKLAQKNSIQTRLRALKKYGYPRSQYIYVLLAQFFYWLTPLRVKKALMKQI